MNTLPRRRFLALSAAASLGATWFDAPRVLQAAGVAADDAFHGWPVGVQSYSLRNFSLAEAVRHMEGMGVHFTEMFSKHLAVDADGDVLRETLALLERAGIRLNAHGVSEFTADHEANRRLFEFAKRAGFRNLTANPRAESFDSLDKLCAEFDIRICIHNHGPGALYDTIESVEKAVEGRDKRIGACVDTGHFIRSKIDPVEAVRRLGARVFAVHMKDEEKQEARSENVVLGKGHLDLVGLFKALREVKFPADGSLSLEFEAHPANPIDDMRQCLDAVRGALAKLGG